MFSVPSNVAWQGFPLHRIGAALCPVSYSIATGSLMPTAQPQQKSRGGCPKIDPASVRAYRVNARLTADELSMLNAKAAEPGIPPAQFLRGATLKRRLPSCAVLAINRQQYAELARLSANLNQLAHAANFDQDAVTTARRPDRAEALKKAHKAAAYDAWFRAEVQKELDDPSPELTHEEAQADMKQFFARLGKRG